MKKILLVLLLALTIILPLSAKDDHFDIALSFGSQMRDIRDGIDLYTGAQFGLTSTLEMGLWLESSLTPEFFKDNAVGLELSYAFMGRRSTASRVAGSGINMLINTGLIVDKKNPSNVMDLTSVYLSLTPLTAGSPISSIRERIATIGVVYNWKNNEFSVIFSLIKQDFYIRNSWKDYYR